MKWTSRRSDSRISDSILSNHEKPANPRDNIDNTHAEEVQPYRKFVLSECERPNSDDTGSHPHDDHHETMYFTLVDAFKFEGRFIETGPSRDVLVDYREILHFNYFK